MSSNTSPTPRERQAPPPPQEGQLFKDREGRLWRVAAVINESRPGTFYLVDLTPGHAPEGDREELVLSPREYADFISQRRLRPL
ncbi:MULTISPECIES: hypothetical protein [Ramlibacter]|uniref:Uncharacterized protein n=1 Tax=Ramlibacter aquaticus TaxID=2780094 RepID=A0ABR9SFF0_9BURK|nr:MULTISPECIES: hypothetical protein [Ramlibacter]MBE7941070.1 hypothetical protein [Ramlibacter aquaticus]